MFFEANSPFKEKIKTEKAQLPVHVGRVKCRWMAGKFGGPLFCFKGM